MVYKKWRNVWQFGGSLLPLTDVEVRLHFGNKNKKTYFYFVFRSICTNFAGDLLVNPSSHPRSRVGADW